MREKFLWVGVIIIIISGIANYVYFESKQLSNPVFLDHYIKKPFNLHENQLTFFYLTNKHEPLQVSYVQIDGERFYPSASGSGFMTFHENRNYIPHEEEYSHYYLMRERISFPAEMLPQRVAEKQTWSFSEIEVGFTNGKQITADIGKVVLSRRDSQRKVFDFRMASSSNQYINQAAMTAKGRVTINDIVIPFPEASEHVSIKVDVEQERLNELDSVRNGGKIPEWLRDNKKWVDFDGKLLSKSILPISLQKNEWMRLMTAVNHDSYFELEMEIQGMDRTGSPFFHPVMIHNRPELTQGAWKRLSTGKQVMMMHKACMRMFWGFLITLIEIHFLVIDILPDPLGYALIAAGVSSILEDFPIGKKAYNIAVLLGVLSIPGVFIQQIGGNGVVQSLSAAGVYSLVLSLINLVLVFYTFQLLMDIANKRGEGELINQTSIFFKIYIITMLVIQILQSFTLNMHGALLQGYIVVAVIISLVLQVTFLGWIFRFRKYDLFDEAA